VPLAPSVNAATVAVANTTRTDDESDMIFLFQGLLLLALVPKTRRNARRRLLQPNIRIHS
jgi:hypothetical protein